MWNPCNCPYNPGIVCQGKRPAECAKCGWCPAEEQRRKEYIREHIEETVTKCWRYDLWWI